MPLGEAVVTVGASLPHPHPSLKHQVVPFLPLVSPKAEWFQPQVPSNIGLATLNLAPRPVGSPSPPHHPGHLRPCICSVLQNLSGPPALSLSFPQSLVWIPAKKPLYEVIPMTV